MEGRERTANEERIVKRITKTLAPFLVATGGGDWEDATQEARLAYWEVAKEGAPPELLYRMALFRAVDAVRKRYGRKPRVATTAYIEGAERDANAPDPAKLAIEAERREFIAATLDAAKLTPKQRAAIERYYFQGKNDAEAGKAEGIEKSGHFQRRARALDAIRDAIDEKKARELME